MFKIDFLYSIYAIRYTQDKRQTMDKIEFDNISILMPIYNRTNWKPLIIQNLKCQEYPHKHLTFIMDDDGTEPFFESKEDQENFQDIIYPIKLVYNHRKDRRSIGAKRNSLCKSVKDKILCFMDSDDIYIPTYVSYSWSNLKGNKVGLVGSAQMLFYYPIDDNYTAIKCSEKHQFHEATMMMTKKYFRSMKGFSNNSQGEGADIILGNENNCYETKIEHLMICICHKDNTVDKNQFRDAHKIDDILPVELKDLIKKISNV